MKKTIAMILVFVLCASMMVFGINAAPPKEYPVLKAGTVPKLDGVVNADEWANAKLGHVDNTATVQWGDATDPIKGDFYGMWTEEGMYFAAYVYDDKNGIGICSKDDVYSRGDGVQFMPDPAYRRMETAPQADANCYIFDVYPDYPSWYEHFIYGEKDANGYVPMPTNTGIVVAGTTGTDTWTVECFIPWEAMNYDKAGFSGPIAEGMKMSLAYIIMDYDSAHTSIAGFCSFDAWETKNYDTGILSNTLGGIIPAPETEAAQSDAAAPATTAAAQTDDSTIVFGTAFVLLSAMALLIVTKKKITGTR
jgi:hypothetical protein